MKIYIVSISKEAFWEIAGKLPPESRYTCMGVFPSPHYWLRDDEGNVVVLTPASAEPA